MFDIPVYDRDNEDLPEYLCGCIVFWRKGTSDRPFFKGEIFDDDCVLISDHCDEVLGTLISRLKDDASWCACCHHLVDKSLLSDAGACPDCEERFK